MDAKTRALIEILRDETQSRSVYDRCNEVLNTTPLERTVKAPDIVWAKRKAKPNAYELAWKRLALDEIHATEAEVEIITGEKRNGDQ